MKRRPISCFVIAYNEEDRLAGCLEPLAGWVDELIVLDSGSSDRTAEIARQYASRVEVTDWPGFGAQRNRALGMCSHDWVLNVDADERVTDELKDEIDELLAEPDLDANLVKIPWCTYFLGKPLRHGRYCAPQGKLFLKRGVHFKHARVHENLQIPDPKVRVVRSPLIHHSWRDYRHAQEKHLQYASLLALDKYEQGRRSTVAYALLRFFTDFLQQYLLRLGFLDGTRGLLMALVLGQYAFHKYAALSALALADQATDSGERAGQRTAGGS